MKKRPFILLELLIAIGLSAILLTVLFRFLVSNAHVERQIEKAQALLLERQRLQERLESILTNIEPPQLEHPSFYTDPFPDRELLSLIAVFNAGIDPDPAYSGPNTSRLYLTKEGKFCLTQWPLKAEGSRTETLLSNVQAIEWEFLGHPNEPVAKFHDSEKSMILKPLARTGEACPGCADGGLPRRAGESAQPQEDSKGRFCASKSFATGSNDKDPRAVSITDTWAWLKTWPKNKGALPSIIRLKFWCGIDKNLQREPNLQLAVILPTQEPIKIAKR